MPVVQARNIFSTGGIDHMHRLRPGRFLAELRLDGLLCLRGRILHDVEQGLEMPGLQAWPIFT